MAERKNFDSDFCGSLPLHHINSIQDYGYLLVLDRSNLSIIQASENLAELLGKNIQDLMNVSLAEYFEQQELDKIIRISNGGLTNRIPLTLVSGESFGGYTFQALQHTKSAYILLELEKTDKGTTRSFIDVYQTVKYISAVIEQADNVQEVCDLAVHELRKLSEFDGVLMYKFDDYWNGTVIAEEKDPRLEPYLGQTFPASDVPKQARELYLRNPYRLIPDRAYKAIRLYPVINPLSNAFTDLSDCNLRGVAAVHLEYMKNMDVDASMSIRVIYNQQLWGLISCHHIDKKYISYELCSIFEWLSDVISGRITLILNKEEFRLSQELQQIRGILTDRIYAENQIAAGLFNEESNNILQLFKAGGAVISLNGRIESIGEVPPKDDLENIMLWLEGKKMNKVFATQNFAGIYDDAAAFAAQASGLLVIPVNADRADFVLCFRPEVIEDIHWGGNPNQAINFEKDGKNYHPRNSFELWKQTVLHHSLPWSLQELEVAESLRNFLFEFRTKQLEH
jgi:chemotaxis family two-component system sensor kinase Cph1